MPHQPDDWGLKLRENVLPDARGACQHSALRRLWREIRTLIATSPGTGRFGREANRSVDAKTELE